MDIITHYTKLTTLLNYILEDKTFRFNLLSKTNDPYEYLKYSSTGCLGGGKPEEMSKIMQIMTAIRKDKIKVGCFVSIESENFKDIQSSKSILNAPLWAHYGDNYRGVAIVFDKKLLIDSCKNHIIDDWAILKNFIDYDPEFDFSDPPNKLSSEEIGSIDEVTIARLMLEKSKRYLFHKDPKWNYEDEFRILLYSDAVGPVDVNIQGCIKGIVFGKEVSTFLTNSLESSLKEMDINCFRISFDEVNKRLICKDA
jgi:hypothetical protein